MSVNFADGILFGSLPVYPFAAACGAFCAGARWTTPLFFLAGCATGVLVVVVSRFLLYATTDRIIRSGVMQDEDGWAAWILGGPLMLACLVFPWAVTTAGFYLTFQAGVRAANTHL
jgi:hypothetical protein